MIFFFCKETILFLKCLPLNAAQEPCFQRAWSQRDLGSNPDLSIGPFASLSGLPVFKMQILAFALRVVGKCEEWLSGT